MGPNKKRLGEKIFGGNGGLVLGVKLIGNWKLTATCFVFKEPFFLHLVGVKTKNTYSR